MLVISIVAASHKMITRNRQVDQYLRQRESCGNQQPQSMPLCVCVCARELPVCVYSGVGGCGQAISARENIEQIYQEHSAIKLELRCDIQSIITLNVPPLALIKPSH
jgi:hypothetical protein